MANNRVQATLCSAPDPRAPERVGDVPDASGRIVTPIPREDRCSRVASTEHPCHQEISHSLDPRLPVLSRRLSLSPGFLLRGGDAGSRRQCSMRERPAFCLTFPYMVTCLVTCQVPFMLAPLPDELIVPEITKVWLRVAQ